MVRALALAECGWDVDEALGMLRQFQVSHLDKLDALSKVRIWDDASPLPQPFCMQVSSTAQQMWCFVWLHHSCACCSSMGVKGSQIELCGIDMHALPVSYGICVCDVMQTDSQGPLMALQTLLSSQLFNVLCVLQKRKKLLEAVDEAAAAGTEDDGPSSSDADSDDSADKPSRKVSSCQPGSCWTHVRFKHVCCCTGMTETYKVLQSVVKACVACQQH